MNMAAQTSTVGVAEKAKAKKPSGDGMWASRHGGHRTTRRRCASYTKENKSPAAAVPTSFIGVLTALAAWRVAANGERREALKHRR